MRHLEYTWQARDGLHLFARCWAPEAAPRACVCLIHGIGEHSGCYTGMADALTAAGITLFALDLRGNGHSEGVRGHAPDFALLLDDIALLLRQTAIHAPGVPLFLFGHSMGGNLALNFALRCRQPLAGVIVSGAALRTGRPTPLWKLTAAAVMLLLWPSFQFQNGVPPTACTRGSDHDDPLAHHLISARLGLDLLCAGRWALAHAGDFPVPLLMMYGAGERVVSTQAIDDFCTHAPHCTRQVWPDFLHELHSDPECACVFAAMIAWIDAQLPRE